MSTAEILRANLLSPIVLAFALGVLARLVRSELRIPQALYTSLSIYLLLALGLKGGHELAHVGLAPIAKPAAITVLLGCITPVTAYFRPSSAGALYRSRLSGHRRTLRLGLCRNIHRRTTVRDRHGRCARELHADTAGFARKPGHSRSPSHGCTCRGNPNHNRGSAGACRCCRRRRLSAGS